MTGTLVLIVGPSGAGKDSIIAGARAALMGDSSFHFARRVITRDASHEDHDTMSRAEFDAAERKGGFIMSWRAHGVAYGVPASVQDTRRAGTTVIANVSRLVVDEARAKLQPVRVVLVTAPADQLAARLTARGREDEDDIVARLRRADADLPSGPDVVVIHNEGPLSDAVLAFLEFLRSTRVGRAA